MNLIRDMAAIKDRVVALLGKHPHLRDSDNKLIATIWKFELLHKKLEPTSLSALDFLELYANGELTNSESIRRVRQKIQEEVPELRGLVYLERQDQGEEVRKEIVK